MTDGVKRFRIVQIFPGSTGTGAPEYRLFDIDEGTPPYLAGLRNGDILLTANGYAVVNPVKFRIYLELLAQEQSGTIRVRRDGRIVALQIRLID